MSRAVAVAVASAALRRLAAASRPLIATRAISSSPAVVGRPVLLFRPGPVSLFPRDQSRSYARRRVNSDSESEYFDDSDEDDGNLNYPGYDGGSDLEKLKTGKWESDGWEDLEEESEDDSKKDSKSKRPRRR